MSITVRKDVDTDPDLSWIGEYASQPGLDDRTVDRQERGDQRHGEYRYFIATNSAEETGNPESVEQDYQRMEGYNHRQEWCMVGLWAEAKVQLGGTVVQTIRSGGLWGIESDSDKEHFESVEKEELSALADELEAIGFTKHAIKSAMKNVEHKE